MAMTEDLAAFFDTDEFADNALLSGVAVVGIFDNPFETLGGGLGMASSSPSFTLATNDVPSEPVGKSFVFDSVTYEVTAHEPDGTGVSVLTLGRTS